MYGITVMLLLNAAMFVSGQILSNPVHTAQLIGGSAEMLCAYNSVANPDVQWKHYDMNNVTNDVTEGEHYDVTTTSSSTLLRFKDLKPEMAGDYVCQLTKDGTVHEANATLVVVEDLHCGTNVSEALEGEDVQLFGYVYFYGHIHSKTFSIYSQYVSLPWMRRGTQFSTFFDDRKLFNVSVTVAKEDNGVEFEGKFGLTAQPSFGLFDENDFSYVDTCKVSISVLYAPTDPFDLFVNGEPPKAVSDSTRVSVGDDIRCNASANPVPEYRWRVETIDGETGERMTSDFNSHTFTISESMMGSIRANCTAKNDHGEVSKEWTLTVESSVAAISKSTTAIILLCLVVFSIN